MYSASSWNKILMKTRLKNVPTQELVKKYKVSQKQIWKLFWNETLQYLEEVVSSSFSLIQASTFQRTTKLLLDGML